MTKKGTDIVAYLTLIGWILAFGCGNREESKFHLNQALVLMLARIVWGLIAKVLVFIPIIGWIVIAVGYICLSILWIIGLINAIQGTEKPLPIIGELQILS